MDHKSDSLKLLDNKLAISQNNPMCGAEEQRPNLKKKHTDLV